MYIFIWTCLGNRNPERTLFLSTQKLFTIIKTKTPCLKDTVMLPLPIPIFLSHFLKISGSVASIPLSSSPAFPGPLVPVSVHPGALVYLPLHDPTSASTLPAGEHKRHRVNMSKHQRVTDGHSMIQVFQSTRIMQLSRIVHLPATPLANNVNEQICIKVIL